MVNKFLAQAAGDKMLRDRITPKLNCGNLHGKRCLTFIIETAGFMNFHHIVLEYPGL